MLCVLCDKPLAAQRARGLTDCAHEFCLTCVCRRLTELRNLCPVCGTKVKTVHELQDSGDADSHANAPAPASVRFNNAVYVLNVSIWAVDDPARVLAELFHLEQARLIHKGKLLKKGDVWPGTVVQLFGTRKSTVQQANGVGSWTAFAPWNLVSVRLVQRVTEVLCCPLSVLYDFFRSMFVNDDRERRGYQRLDQNAATASDGATAQQPQTFSAPGRVTSPHLIDLEE